MLPNEQRTCARYINYLLLWKELPIMILSHYFCESGIQASLSWVLQLRISHQVAVKLAAVGPVLPRFDWSTIHFQAHSCGCWTEGLSSLMAFGQRPLLILAIWLSPKGHAHHHGRWIPSEQQVRKQKRASRMEVTVFHDSVLEVTPSTWECDCLWR